MTNQSPLTYAVVRVQIEGNPERGFKTAYYTDGQRRSSKTGAINHGINDLGHDDFLLAHLRGDALVMTSWQHTDRPMETHERSEMAEQCGWKVWLDV